MARRLMKILHTLGAIGVMGTLAAIIVLAWTAPTGSPADYAAVRAGIWQLANRLLLPSLLLVFVSGLLAMAITDAFKDAGWAWAKALSGLVMFEGTLLTVGAGARRAAELSALAAADAGGDPAALAAVVRSEWNSLWLLLVLSAANVVLGVWRPRFARRARASAPAVAPAAATPTAAPPATATPAQASENRPT